MSELKPGEYVGADGLVHRAHLHHSVEHGEGWWWPSQNQVLPDDPDFPAAVEALAKLVSEPFEWDWGGWSYDYQNGVVTRYSPSQSGLLDHESTAAFEAGRRFERERGHADE